MVGPSRPLNLKSANTIYHFALVEREKPLGVNNFLDIVKSCHRRQHNVREDVGVAQTKTKLAQLLPP